ncbi:MAG: L-lysine 6-transaminase [bacterium]|nr:L-lysine 6-transaminase [bacterium]
MDSVTAGRVREVLAKHMLADGLDLVIDLEQSKGSWLVDKKGGARYLDFFSMYASMAVGYNHPKLRAVQKELGAIAINKPSNPDAYTETMAEFVETFSQAAIPDYLPHAFFIEGGALAVENGLKAAFDWKVRKNLAQGYTGERGTQVIHFEQAFHGRSGYTLSLTNTHDSRKTKYYPKFKWPRIPNPKLTFPLNAENQSQVEAAERKALKEIEQVLATHGDDVAALIIEPIQGEGGDNHFRPEFLQQLRQLCNENDVLFILDEIQTGVGLTGKFWAHEHLYAKPDILVFGKKTQVCGILVSRRIDEVAENVFHESSRINSTFGGNLVDMARFTHILRIMEQEKLVNNAATQGSLLLSEIQKMAHEFPQLVSNPRGRGLMCAFDLPDSQTRDRMRTTLMAKKLLILGCGEKSIRFRPHLNVKAEEIQEGMEIVGAALKEIAA